MREQLNNASASPQPRGQSSKLIHFVRHAQGHHNVAGEADWEEYKSEKYEDATLSELGERQCMDLNIASADFIRECVEGNRAELIVTSVLGDVSRQAPCASLSSKAGCHGWPRSFVESRRASIRATVVGH